MFQRLERIDKEFVVMIPRIRRNRDKDFAEYKWEVAVIGGCYYSWDYPAWSLHRLIEIANLPQYWECISGNWYEEVIASIQSKIHIGELNKEYLEE